MRVLLLEAGPPDRHPLQAMPLAFPRVATGRIGTWQYMSEPEPGLGGRTLPVPRGRTLGGTSSINAMIAIRGNRRDYDDWGAMGLSGWGFAEVLPYFRRLESHWRGTSEWHGGSGPVRIEPVGGTRPLVGGDTRRGAGGGNGFQRGSQRGRAGRHLPDGIDNRRRSPVEHCAGLPRRAAGRRNLTISPAPSPAASSSRGAARSRSSTAAARSRGPNARSSPAAGRSTLRNCCCFGDRPGRRVARHRDRAGPRPARRRPQSHRTSQHHQRIRLAREPWPDPASAPRPRARWRRRAGSPGRTDPSPRPVRWPTCSSARCPGSTVPTCR